jgi:hypothetical protein
MVLTDVSATLLLQHNTIFVIFQICLRHSHYRKNRPTKILICAFGDEMLLFLTVFLPFMKDFHCIKHLIQMNVSWGVYIVTSILFISIHDIHYFVEYRQHFLHWRVRFEATPTMPGVSIYHPYHALRLMTMHFLRIMYGTHNVWLRHHLRGQRPSHFH